MIHENVIRLAAVGCVGLLMAGCVMAEKYEAEKARSLNFQRLLAQEEKRTGDLDAELKRVKREASELEARNRELTAQVQAVREQLARIQEEAAAAREAEGMRTQMKGGSKKKARKAKPETPAEPSAPEAAPAPAAAEGSPSVHVVQAGETIFRIARQYGVSVQQIRQWNNLKNDVIEIGQQLVVAPPQP
ncbi:MAG: LysM peptidoglycan-binding domain-containing protein [Nitrospira sp.]|nr:LysM peptidoglycan-binding domain-containing protein [Nitrospira sp.]